MLASPPPASRLLSQRALLDLSSSVSRRSVIFGTKGNSEQIAANVASAKMNRRMSPRFLQNQPHTFDTTEIDSPFTSVAAEGKGLFFGGSGSVPYDKPAIFKTMVEEEKTVETTSVSSSLSNHSLGFLVVLFFISVLFRSINQDHDQTNHFGLHFPRQNSFVSPVVETAEAMNRTIVNRSTVVLPWKKVNKTTDTIISVQPILKPSINVAMESVPQTVPSVPRAESRKAETLPVRDGEGRLVLGRSYSLTSDVLPPITAEILSSSDSKSGSVRYFISVDVSRIRLHPLHSRLCAAISSSPSSPPSFSSCMTASSSQLFWASSLGKNGPHKHAVAFTIDNLKVEGGTFTVSISIMDMRGKTEKIGLTVNVTEQIETALPIQDSVKRKLASISATW